MVRLLLQRTFKKISKYKNEISENLERISNLETSKADIDFLGADEDNMYKLTNNSDQIHRVRQGEEGLILIDTSSDALSIHEITHVRQSLVAGGLKFSPDGNLCNSGRTEETISNNEVEAYQKQYSFDRSFPGRTDGLQGIDVHSVGNIRNSRGDIVQPVIYDYARRLKK